MPSVPVTHRRPIERATEARNHCLSFRTYGVDIPTHLSPFSRPHDFSIACRKTLCRRTVSQLLLMADRDKIFQRPLMRRTLRALGQYRDKLPQLQ